MYPLPGRKHRMGLRRDSNQPGQLVYVHQYMNAGALPSIACAGRLPQVVGLLVLLPGKHAQRLLLLITKAMGSPKLIKERLPFLFFAEWQSLLEACSFIGAVPGYFTLASRQDCHSAGKKDMYTLGNMYCSRDLGEILPQSTSYALPRAERSRRTDHRQSCQPQRRQTHARPVVHR
jgi:hypothetical protein